MLVEMVAAMAVLENLRRATVIPPVTQRKPPGKPS